jgi:hypothetical protein
MKCTVVRFAAAALAGGFTLLQLTGIALIAEGAVSWGDPVLVLPRTIITPVASAPRGTEVRATRACDASLSPT